MFGDTTMIRAVIYLVTIIVTTLVGWIALQLHASILVAVLAASSAGGISIAVAEKILENRQKIPA
jgi:hypothetical protein